MKYLSNVISNSKKKDMIKMGMQLFKKKDYHGTLLIYSFLSMLGTDNASRESAYIWKMID